MDFLHLFKISRILFCCNVFLASYQLDAPTGKGQVWTCLPTELMYFCQFLSAENTPFCSSQQQLEQKPRISDQIFLSKLYHVAQLEPGGKADYVFPFFKRCWIILFIYYDLNYFSVISDYLKICKQKANFIVMNMMPNKSQFEHTEVYVYIFLSFQWTTGTRFKALKCQ